MAVKTETVDVEFVLHSGEAFQRNFPLRRYEGLSLSLNLHLIERDHSVDLYVDDRIQASVPTEGGKTLKSVSFTFE